MNVKRLFEELQTLESKQPNCDDDVKAEVEAKRALLYEALFEYGADIKKQSPKTLKWRDVPETERPFATPEEEFLYSKVKWGSLHLQARWAGLGFEKMLIQLETINADRLVGERIRIQQKIMRLCAPETQRRIADADEVVARAEKTLAHSEAGRL